MSGIDYRTSARTPPTVADDDDDDGGLDKPRHSALQKVVMDPANCFCAGVVCAIMTLLRRPAFISFTDDDFFWVTDLSVGETPLGAIY